MNFTIHGIIICLAWLQHDISLFPAKRYKNYLFFHCSHSCSVTAVGLLSLLEKKVWFPLQLFLHLLFHKASSYIVSISHFAKITLVLYYADFFSHGKTASWCQHLEHALYKPTLLPFSTKEFHCYRANIPSLSTISQQIVLTLPFFFSNFRRTTVAWRAESLSYSQIFTHLEYRETNITGSSTTVQRSKQKLSIIVRYVPWLQKKTCLSDPT